MQATFILDSPEKAARCAARIKALPMDGRIWDVQIRPYEARRSLEANRRLWALHKLASEVTGHSVDELHELMKWKFLPHIKVTVGKESREVASSSATLKKKDFTAFMEAVEEFYISELGVFLGDL